MVAHAVFISTMSIGEAIVLGLVQGLSEFLPISSSAHLVLAEHVLGVEADLAYEVFLHAGTLVAVLIFFRRRIVDMLLSLAQPNRFTSGARFSRREALLLVIGSVPAAIIGLLFKDEIEQVFADVTMTAVFLSLTGLILLSTYLRKSGGDEVRAASAWWVGCAQAVAILPGISRSGSTISAGLWLGVQPARAAEFSFLLSIPAVGGAILLTLPDAWGAGRVGINHLVGAAVAGVSGYYSMRVVFNTLRSGRFALFGVYCLIVGVAALLLLK